MIRFAAAATVVLLMGARVGVAQDSRLDLTLTARKLVPGTDANGHPVTTLVDIQTGGTIPTLPGQSYLVELRYRIADLAADTTGSLGLSAAQIVFTGSS